MEIVAVAIIVGVFAFLLGKACADAPIHLENQEKQRHYDELLQQISECEVKIAMYQEHADAQHRIAQDAIAKYKDMEKQEQEHLFAIQEENKVKIQEQLDYLESLRQTKIAATQALKKEQQIAEDPSLYLLPLTEDEVYDISYLNQIKKKMRNPEVIGKVIWSAFIQKKYNTFAANILGTQVIGGVYKITDQITQEAYIGQSVNIASRWKDHIKYGIGANSASVSNQLYAAIKRDGIENFTFELLEECSSDQLNEKEKYYISLYQTDTYGLNSTKGGS